MNLRHVPFDERCTSRAPEAARGLAARLFLGTQEAAWAARDDGDAFGSGH